MLRKPYTPDQIIGKLREAELLNWEVFDTLLEAQILTEDWRRKYNQVRSHSSLGYRPPVPQAVLPSTGSFLSLEVVY